MSCSSTGCHWAAIYALIALGFVIVFKATRVVNFAYGSLLLLGAYVVGRYHDRLGFVPAVLVAVAVTAAVAALIGVVLLRRGPPGRPGHARDPHPRRGHRARHRADPPHRH